MKIDQINNETGCCNVKCSENLQYKSLKVLSSLILDTNQRLQFCNHIETNLHDCLVSSLILGSLFSKMKVQIDHKE